MKGRRNPAAYGPGEFENVKNNLLDPKIRWTKAQLMDVARTLVTTVERRDTDIRCLRGSLEQTETALIHLEELRSKEIAAQ